MDEIYRKDHIKNILRKVIISQEGFYVECYGLAPIPTFTLDSKQESSIFQENKERELNRSRVHPLSQLVEEDRARSKNCSYL